MNNSESNPFLVFTKQSPVAIIILIWKYFINIIRQFWPAIIAIFIGRNSGNVSTIVLISVIVIAVSSLVFAILYYFRFSFRIRGDELFIEKGVFKKSKLNIPFERIQTLNFEQGIIHQMFNVVKVEVDTAGSSKNEFTFNALDKGKAETLRKLILEKKSILVQANADTSADHLESVLEEQDHEKIFSLKIKDLFLIGLTQNHLRTLVLLFFFSLWGFNELEDAGLNLDWLSMENAEVLVNSGIAIVLGLGLLFLLVTIIGTSVRTILKYYDFKMFRAENGFKIQSGLFNRKEHAALDHKIQQIKWVNNPLKRIIGMNQLQLKQASSIEVSAKKSIRVPGIQIEKITRVLQYILGPKFDHNSIHVKGIDKRYFGRILMYFAIIPWIILCSSVLYFTESSLSFLILLPIPYLSITYYVAYKKWKYGLNKEVLYTHSGIFENRSNIVQLHKIQNIKISQSPFQWRRDLASLRIHTAAGSVYIPYISIAEASNLKDYLLYRVESSQEKWY